MNAILATAYPLPSILNASTGTSAPSRRKSIGEFLLGNQELDRFNQLLGRLGRPHPPLALDQLATAAREINRSQDSTAQPCIAQRIQRSETVAAMVADTAWAIQDETQATARLVLDYVRGLEKLIPAWLPKVGRLDDAIVVDAAWPVLVPEVQGYLDFCRLRHLQAQLRACNDHDFSFTRKDWIEARQVEATLQAQRRRIRESSYLPVLSNCFRVH